VRSIGPPGQKPKTKGASVADLLAFVQGIARLTKDCECPYCKGDGLEPNPACATHDLWVMENDDAVSTLHALIEEARFMTREARG
jgi:hypothetical protein